MFPTSENSPHPTSRAAGCVARSIRILRNLQAPRQAMTPQTLPLSQPRWVSKRTDFLSDLKPQLVPTLMTSISMPSPILPKLATPITANLGDFNVINPADPNAANTGQGQADSHAAG